VRYSLGVAAIFAAIGTVVAPPATAGPLLPQGKIDTLLLSDDDVSSIIGLPLHRAGDIYPSPGLPSPPIEHNECRSFVQFDASVWTGEFTAFRQVTQKDNPDDLQFVDMQLIALYPNERVAAQTFRHGFPTDLVGRCGNSTLVDSFGAHWRIERPAITGNRASWVSADVQNGQDTTWHCANEIRLKGNAMFQDNECQWGNGSSVAAQMADLTASRIPS
jgi:PknH-like extracellular domain